MRNTFASVIKPFAKYFLYGILSGMAGELLDTAAAAKVLGISTTRVRVLIREKRLPAEKLGRDYIIRRKDLARVKDRPTGRPPKE